jgi:DNA end-binding protein Ku
MPIASGILSFGLVAIPVKLSPAIKDKSIHFHLLHGKCGTRIRNQLFCPHDNEVVEREDLVRGFEYAKGKYIQFTEEELEALEAEANRNIDLKQFVPVSTVDPLYFESSYYVGADEGSEKPYRLLSDALAKTQRVAVAELVSRGKEQVVIIRPYQRGLMLHSLYYKHEARNVKQIPRAEEQRVKEEELDLGVGLIDQMSNEKFEPEKYQDEYRLRVLALSRRRLRPAKKSRRYPDRSRPSLMHQLLT